MDITTVTNELSERRLVVVCFHEHAAECLPTQESWVCASGVVHGFDMTVAAAESWKATLQAWADLFASQEDGDLAEFRRAERALVRANDALRAQLLPTIVAA